MVLNNRIYLKFGCKGEKYSWNGKILACKKWIACAKTCGKFDLMPPKQQEI